MRRSIGLCAVLCVALLATACGSRLDDSSDEAEATTAEAMAKVVEQLDGLDKEARRAKLIELAEAEGGQVKLYAATASEDLDPLLEAYQEDTGMTVSSYRTAITALVQRIFQERSAGYRGWDVVMVRGSNCTQFENEGMLLSLETPLRETLGGNFGSEYWLPPYVSARMVAWNTNNVTGDDVPTDWDDVLNNYSGRIAMDPSQWGWFQALAQGYFIGELGMTEDEVVALFQKTASGARPVEGSTLTAELLGAGEFDIATSIAYHSLPTQDPTAPVAWEPFIQPVPVEPYCIAISATSENVASALLLTEYILDEGQTILGSVGRTVANPNVPGGLPSELKVVVQDPSSTAEDFEHWEELYQQVFQGA